MIDSKSPFGSTVTRGKPVTKQAPASTTSAVAKREERMTLLDFLPDQAVANLPQENRDGLVKALDLILENYNQQMSQLNYYVIKLQQNS